MPFCLNIKQKLRQQQLQQRLKEAAMMRRRMAQMNARMNPGGLSAGGGGHSGKDSGGGGVANTPQYIQQPANSGPGKPGMNAQPNQAVMDAVKKVRQVSVATLTFSNITSAL